MLNSMNIDEFEYLKTVTVLRRLDVRRTIRKLYLPGEFFLNSLCYLKSYETSPSFWETCLVSKPTTFAEPCEKNKGLIGT